MNTNNPAAVAGMLGFELVLFAIIYIATAIPVYLLAQKMGHANPWFAFVPILNIWQLTELSGSEPWTIILVLVPCVNIFILIRYWWLICEERGKAGVLSLIMFIPFGSIALPLILLPD